MAFYVTIYLALLVPSLLEFALSDRDRSYLLAGRWFFWSLAAGLFVIAAFRECGFDYDSYRGIYHSLHARPGVLAIAAASGTEPLYALLNYIAPDYRTVIAVMTTAIFAVQIPFIRRYSRRPLLSLLVYLCVYLLFSTMGQYRQALAVGIVLWAFVHRDRKLVFFLLIALAAMFHTSALIGLLALAVPREVRGAGFYATLLVGALAFGMLARGAYSNLIGIMPPFISAKMAVYAATETEPLGLTTAVLFRGALFFLCWWNRERLGAIEGMPFFTNLFFLSLVVYLALGFAPQLGGRGSTYFAFLEVILSANLVASFRTRPAIVFFGFFALLSAYRMFNSLQNWADAYIPYRNWLFHNVI